MSIFAWMYSPAEPNDEDPLPVETTGEREDSSDNRFSQLLGFRRKDIRDFGVIAAKTGRGLQPYIDRIRASYEAIQSAINDELNGELSDLRKRQDELDAQIDQARKQRDQHADQQGIRDVPTPIRRLRTQLEVKKERSEAEAEDLERRLELARTLRRQFISDLDENNSDLQHQQELLLKKQEQCIESLEEARRRSEALNARGISVHTAGFIIWASYASLLGAGAAVARVLERLMSNPEGPRSSRIAEMLAEIRSLEDLGAFFLGYAGIVGSAIAVVGLVTLGAHWLLMRLDPDRDKERQSRDSQDEAPGAADFVNSFGVHGLLSSMNKHVSARSLIGLVGVLAFLFAGAIVAFLLVAFGDGATNGDALLAGYLGPAYVLLTSVGILLFYVNVLEPKRMGTPADGWSTAFHTAVALTPPLSLLGVAFLPVGNTAIALTLIAFAMLIACTGVVFGLSYRGQFLREEYLERCLSRIQRALHYLRWRAGTLSFLPQRDSDHSEKRSPIREQFSMVFNNATAVIRRVVRSNSEEHEQRPGQAEALDICEEDTRAIDDLTRKRAATHAEIVQIQARCRDRQCRLDVEYQRVLLELENAYSVAGGENHAFGAGA